MIRSVWQEYQRLGSDTEMMSVNWGCKQDGVSPACNIFTLGTTCVVSWNLILRSRIPLREAVPADLSRNSNNETVYQIFDTAPGAADL